MKTRAKIEWTLIYIISLMLIISLCGAIGNSVTASSARQYPNLYAPVSEVETDETSGVIYLTFDDGPCTNTEDVLDVLKENGVKATFFVTVQLEDEEYVASMLKKIIEEGHAIGLHSYTHDFGSIYKSVDSYLADINKLNDFIIESTGVRPAILRFPGGSHTANCKRGVMKDIIKEIERRGYEYYDWDIVSGDDTPTARPAGQLFEKIVKGTKYPDSAVVLAHDNPCAKTTGEAVRTSIAELKEMGYSFDVLTPNVKAVHLK